MGGALVGSLVKVRPGKRPQGFQGVGEQWACEVAVISRHPVQTFSLGPTSMRAVSALVPVSLGNKHQDDSHFTDRKVEARESAAVQGLHLTGRS